MNEFHLLFRHMNESDVFLFRVETRRSLVSRTLSSCVLRKKKKREKKILEFHPKRVSRNEIYVTKVKENNSCIIAGGTECKPR